MQFCFLIFSFQPTLNCDVYPWPKIVNLRSWVVIILFLLVEIICRLHTYSVFWIFFWQKILKSSLDELWGGLPGANELKSALFRPNSRDPSAVCVYQQCSVKSVLRACQVSFLLDFTERGVVYWESFRPSAPNLILTNHRPKFKILNRWLVESEVWSQTACLRWERI